MEGLEGGNSSFRAPWGGWDKWMRYKKYKGCFQDRGYATVNGVRLRYRLSNPLRHITSDTKSKYRPRHAVITPGGRSGGVENDAFRMLRNALLANGVSVLTWDRRNCGLSELSFKYEDSLGRAEQDASDLHELLRVLRIPSATLIGQSAGGRMTLTFALAYPQLVNKIVLKNLTGGPLALKKLSKTYFKDPIKAAEKEGMEGVGKIEFYQKLLRRGTKEFREKRRKQLLNTDVKIFVDSLTRSEIFLQRAIDPILAFDSSRLSKITQPSLLVYDRKKTDGMHTEGVMEALRKALQSELIVDKNSPHGSVWIAKVVDFVTRDPTRVATRVGIHLPQSAL
uniref:AB hydrolase-1 domain-containing protein n=2 Tax=Amorphochlora amoebiformis TaxID=1561963 RepID=A0A7S0DRK0_9EUKA|mmetsp:Transcript_6575/g.10130  ORF Transcript_6575/g.10130 Transcript_6575/m.10130 type:complete len:338 (+) Transcript_6575:182-1195(+)